MLISVVIPSYNSAKLISAAIESVLSQTYQHFEIIIIDDGSSDNTETVVKSFTDSPVQYYYQNNAGPADARNNGIKKSKGEYIAFLDADDKWYPQKLELQLKVFENNENVCLVYTAMQNIEEGQVRRGIFRYKNYKNKNDFIKFLLLNPISIVPTVLVKKAYLDQYGYFDPQLRTGEDWDLWLRLAIKAKFYYLDEVLAIRYKPITSITASIDRKKAEKCHLLLLNRFFDSVSSDKELFRMKPKAMSAIYYDYSLGYLGQNNFKETFNSIMLSFKYHPLSFLRLKKIKFIIKLLLKYFLKAKF